MKLVIVTLLLYHALLTIVQAQDDDQSDQRYQPFAPKDGSVVLQDRVQP